jgi:hypothetical protein
MALRLPFGKRDAGRSTVDRTEELLRQHLDRDFTVFPMAGTPTSEAQIRTIEKTYRVKYPAEFVAHVLGQFPGVWIEVKEAIWPRPKEYDVTPFWSFLYGLHTCTSAPASEPWMRLDTVAEEFEKMSGLKAAPILRIVGDANVYCATDTATIVRYNHEINKLEPVPGDFWQVLDREVRELRERKDRKKSSQ